MSNPTFDLSAITDIQRNYLADLDEYNHGTGNNPIDTINTQLNDINTVLGDGTVSTEDLLLKQNQISNILDIESNRLKQKERDVEQALQGQKRMIQINKSYGQRYQAFNGILYAIIISFLLIILLILEAKYFNIIPEFIQTILYIIIFATALGYIMFLIFDIDSRKKMDFDKYKMPKPLTADEKTKALNDLTEAGKLSAGLSACVGSECCPGVDNNNVPYYNADTDQCSTQTTQAFTLISESKKEQFDLKKLKNFEPSEFTQYSKI